VDVVAPEYCPPLDISRKLPEGICSCHLYVIVPSPTAGAVNTAFVPGQARIGTGCVIVRGSNTVRSAVNDVTGVPQFPAIHLYVYPSITAVTLVRVSAVVVAPE